MVEGTNSSTGTVSIWHRIFSAVLSDAAEEQQRMVNRSTQVVQGPADPSTMHYADAPARRWRVVLRSSQAMEPAGG